MRTAIRAAQAFRRRWLPPDAFPVRAARALTRQVSRAVYPHGALVPIGQAGIFRIAPELLVGSLDFARWGDGRNAGFAQWITACRSARVAFDIGAHIGLYTLPASRVIAPGGRVFAFEPGTVNRRVLERHVAWNGCSNVTVVPQCVGDAPSDAVQFYEQPHDVVGMNSIVIRSAHARYVARPVAQTSIDAVCAAYGVVPDVVKIDVEGAELHVFRGARAMFTNHHPTIVLSVHPEHLRLLGESADTLMAVVREMGYDVYDVQGRIVQHFAAEEYLLRPARL